MPVVFLLPRHLLDSLFGGTAIKHRIVQKPSKGIEQMLSCCSLKGWERGKEIVLLQV